MFVQAQLMSGEIFSFDFGVGNYNAKKLRIVLSQKLRKLLNSIVIGQEEFDGEFKIIDDQELLLENQKYMIFVN